MGSTHYQILGVAESASVEEIKTAYKKLALRYHPDRTGGNTTLEDHFKKVTAAYHVLSNSERRRIYDLKLASSRIRKTNPATATPKPKTQTSYKKPYPTPSASAKSKTYSTTYKRAKINPAIQRKYYIYTVIITLFIMLGGLLFYRVMNLYSAQVRLEEGISFEAKDNFIQALLSYTQAIHFNPELWEPYYRRGMVYIKSMKNYESALPDLKKAASLAENNHAEIYYQVGISHLALKQGYNAEEALLKSIESDSTFTQSYYALGEVYAYYLDSFEIALPYFEHSLKTNPNHVDAIFGLAFVHFKLQHIEQASVLLEQTLELDHLYKDAYFLRAEIYLSKKDTSNACLEWQKMVEMGDENAKNAVLNYCR